MSVGGLHSKDYQTPDCGEASSVTLHFRGTLAEQNLLIFPQYCWGKRTLFTADALGEGSAPANKLRFIATMVLPVRIELTTSPLPRGCSTTELRQRKPYFIGIS